MKKLLSILGTIALVGTSASGITANKPYTNLEVNNGWSKQIYVNPIAQETDYYCVAASIQMILQNFHVPINIYSQTRIYQELGGSGDEGLNVNQDTANYLNNVRSEHGDTRGINYYYEPLPGGYGRDQSSMLDFQILCCPIIRGRNTLNIYLHWHGRRTIIGTCCCY